MSLLGKTDGERATYTDIAEVIRRHSSAPAEDLQELFRRIVFNVLISNHDDHLRNHGFLYDKNEQWRLAPAYDLNPVPAFETDGSLETAISDASDEASLELAIAAAPYFNIKSERARNIIGQMSTTVGGWQKLARQLGMSASDQGVYASAFVVP
jgi:serine/threonine-protein kinase HipA